jgi:fluoroquinolone transport system permease protein
VNAWLTALRWDVAVQARNGFYWVTAFIVLLVGGLLLALPETARADEAAWVPAFVAISLQITTFFFVAGLVLLERDEGTLAALAVSPMSAGRYLAVHTTSLTLLAAVETSALVWVAFDIGAAWMLLVPGMAVLGVVYTGLGVVVASRYASVNRFLLPASLVVAVLSHFGFVPRWLVLWHPIEPALTLMRAGWRETGTVDLAFGVAGSACWCAIAFLWGRNRIGRLMSDTRAGGGR